MSITIDRPTRSMARAETSALASAKRLNRPRLTIGAARTPVPASRPALRNSLRFTSLLLCPVKVAKLYTLFSGGASTLDEVARLQSGLRRRSPQTATVQEGPGLSFAV